MARLTTMIPHGEYRAGEPMDELAAFIHGRVAEDEEQARQDGTATTVLGERVLIDGEVKRQLVAHVHRADWAYETADEQDYKGCDPRAACLALAEPPRLLITRGG